MGQFDRAVADYTQAIAINRNFAAAYNNRSARPGRGEQSSTRPSPMPTSPWRSRLTTSRPPTSAAERSCYNEQKYDEGIAADNQALAIDPSDAQAYADRASNWDMKGEYDKAKADYYQAITIDPNCVEYYNQLAFFQATCLDAKFRDGKQAFANASKAFQLSNGNNADGNFSVLASAYAENGDFTAALQWQAKAIDLTKSSEMEASGISPALSCSSRTSRSGSIRKTAMQVPVGGGDHLRRRTARKGADWRSARIDASVDRQYFSDAAHHSSQNFVTSPLIQAAREFANPV